MGLGHLVTTHEQRLERGQGVRVRVPLPVCQGWAVTRGGQLCSASMTLNPFVSHPTPPRPATCTHTHTHCPPNGCSLVLRHPQPFPCTHTPAHLSPSPPPAPTPHTPDMTYATHLHQHLPVLPCALQVLVLRLDNLLLQHNHHLRGTGTHGAPAHARVSACLFWKHTLGAVLGTHTGCGAWGSAWCSCCSCCCCSSEPSAQGRGGLREGGKGGG